MILIKKLAALPALILSVLALPFESLIYIIRLFLVMGSSIRYLFYFIARYGIIAVLMYMERDTYMIYWGDTEKFITAILTLFAGFLIVTIPALLICLFFAKPVGSDIHYQMLNCSTAYRVSVSLFGWGLYQLGIRPAWVTFFQRNGWMKSLSQNQ